jgi:hypothetical protein
MWIFLKTFDMAFVVFIDRVSSHSLMINFMIKKIYYIYFLIFQTQIFDLVLFNIIYRYIFKIIREKNLILNRI